jgi:hypothetical protein
MHHHNNLIIYPQKKTQLCKVCGIPIKSSNGNEIHIFHENCDHQSSRSIVRYVIVYWSILVKLNSDNFGHISCYKSCATNSSSASVAHSFGSILTH